MLLSICLIFCQFQPGVAYKCAAYKKACIKISVHPPPPFSAGGWGWWVDGGVGVEPPTKFSKIEYLTRSQFLEGVVGKEGGAVFT